MDQKKSWEDIPSLDGLSVDWDFKAPASTDNRSHTRLNAEDLRELFAKGAIPAKLAVAGETRDARLVDLSRGGVALSLEAPLTVGQRVHSVRSSPGAMDKIPASGPPAADGPASVEP